MATNTVTQPNGSVQWKQLARQSFVVAVVLVIGVGLGMAVGDVPSTAAETLPMEESAGSPAAKAVSEHGEFTPFVYTDPSVNQERYVGSDANLDPDVAAAEHGAFSAMTWRDPSVIQERFVGSDANLDPDVAAAEHGAFSAMTWRDPSVIQERFVGSDANLDADVVAP